MPRVFNPGGAGGVTSVTGAAPITSSGGVTPAIGISPNTYWQTPGTGGNFTGILLGGANQVYVSGLPLQYPISAGHLSFNVQAADNSANVYDLGFYNSAGTLVANLGPASYTTTGYKTVAFSQGTVRFNPGLYFCAFTGNANVLAVYGDGAATEKVWVFGFNANVATSSGGTLPASITPPSAASPTGANSQLWLAMTP